MKPDSNWQTIAELLAESGWSWRHVTVLKRSTPDLHVAEARDESGHVHAVVAEAAEPAFAALEKSIRSVGQ